MNRSQVYKAIIDNYGAENFAQRSRAGYALFNEYGFTTDLSRIQIYEAVEEEKYIRFGVGRHVYELHGSELKKVE